MCVSYWARKRENIVKIFLRSVEYKCSSCGPISCILKPVTDASKKSNEEAKKLAQQINFQVGLDILNLAYTVLNKTTNNTNIRIRLLQFIKQFLIRQ